MVPTMGCSWALAFSQGLRKKCQVKCDNRHSKDFMLGSLTTTEMAFISTPVGLRTALVARLVGGMLGVLRILLGSYYGPRKLEELGEKWLD
jgi:hypothetical protein